MNRLEQMEGGPPSKLGFLSMHIFANSSIGYTLIVILGLALSSGCVHPNIPSIRYGASPIQPGSDVVDLVKDPSPHHIPSELSPHDVGLQPPEMVVNHHPNQAVQLGDPYMDDYCEGDGYLTDRSGSHHQPDTPEAPWPRFHPLPTRPVL